ncbi:MAG: hypothetical protein JSU94_09820 [Phycisphaerales bacterium]|nr:MAG: hypothetical protein JSU94_09820 [Phycisphaerales bacterium]
MLASTISAGVIGGVLAANLRLHLGLPGHKILLWMTPIIIARLLGRCPAGCTVGTLSAGFACLASGGNLAGGVLGLPLAGLGAVIQDTVVKLLEDKSAPAFIGIPAIGITAMVAGILLFIKRSFLPDGLAPHSIFGSADLPFELASYAAFGLISGLIASAVAYLVTRQRGLPCRS